jgi:hypothetical protein
MRAGTLPSPNGCPHHEGNIMDADTNNFSTFTVFLICTAITVGTFAIYVAIFGMRIAS